MKLDNSKFMLITMENIHTGMEEEKLKCKNCCRDIEYKMSTTDGRIVVGTCYNCELEFYRYPNDRSQAGKWSTLRTRYYEVTKTERYFI